MQLCDSLPGFFVHVFSLCTEIPVETNSHPQVLVVIPVFLTFDSSPTESDCLCGKRGAGAEVKSTDVALADVDEDVGPLAEFLDSAMQFSLL